MNSAFLDFFSLGKLTILLFHKVPCELDALEPEEMELKRFEKVLSSVQEIFRVIPLEDAIQALKKGNLPSRSVCITFDDGYRDWMNGVVPVLEKNNAHATFFITTGQFDELPLWNERILHAIRYTDCQNLDFKKYGLPEFSLENLKQKEYTVFQLKKFLKYKDLDFRKFFLQELEQQSNTLHLHMPYMSRSDVRTLHSKGFGIGAHTVSHPILSSCTVKAAYEEIAGSREELISIIKGPVNSFAYPNGIPEKDFTFEHSEMLEKAGYLYGFSTHNGVMTKQSSDWQIPRFTPWGKTKARRKIQFLGNFRNKLVPLKKKESKEKKILMIAFHFPPQAGSSGVQRTLNFVKYLPLYGWSPTVLSAHPAAYLQRSDDLLQSIPANTNVVRSFALDSARHLSIKKKYPGFFAVPDRWSSWWFSGVYSGLKIIKDESPLAIWSTYPIATAHLIAATLHRLTGLPWIADFRDPMISKNHPSQKLQKISHARIENYVMKNAIQCVFTTERAAQEYKKKYPKFSYKCFVIENGYDEEVFLSNNQKTSINEKDSILMLHSGMIYPADRNPGNFLKAIKNLIIQEKIQSKNIKIRFRASQHETELSQLVKNLKMEDWVEIEPPIAYTDAIEEMKMASLLLVFQGKNFNTQIPAKIYEYLRTGKPVMGLVDPEGDTAKKLSEFNAPLIANIESEKDIEKVLSFWLEIRNSKEMSVSIEKDLKKIKSFSRKRQTSLLSDVFRYSGN
jgi:peptidoglycan/xylan/chitin deacetylase (PgdA/CDA1 family)/glycosyltransferase involved in cell wall biosynthesis